ncbi:MAG: thioredoxin family protein [Bacteroidota bacterium]
MRQLLLLTFFLPLSLAAEGIEFFHGSWEEALEAAREQDKLIFVDAYASWCGPCKRMSAQVFPLKDVGDVYNTAFINMKLDMEKPEAMGFRQKHSVSAYPTLFFVNADNEEVHKSVGGKSGPQLIQLASEALARMDDLDAYKAEYEGGERDPQFMYKYIRALVRNGEPHLRIANDYLRANSKNLDTPENLNIILQSATQTDSRIFDLMLEKQTAIIAAHGREAFEAQVRQAADYTRDRAIEFRSEEMLAEVVDHLSSVLPQEAEVFALEGELRLAAKGTDAKKFYKAAKDYNRKAAKNNAERTQALFGWLSTSDFLSDSKVMDMTEELGFLLAEASEGYREYYRLADFLNKQGRNGAAMRAAEKCLERTPEGEPNVKRVVDMLIERIENAG